MKSLKNYAVIALMLVCFQTSWAQYFLKSYDLPPYMTKTEIGRSIEPTSPGSGNWTITGYSNTTPSPGGYNWLFQKVSSTGGVLCTTILGFPLDDSCFSHVKFTGSSINVLSGFYKPFTDMREKASWSMVDTSCVHIMTKTIMDTLRHQYRWVTKDPGNIFTNVGYIESFMPGMTPYPTKILASQYTPAGVLMWAFRYITPGPSSEEAHAVCFQMTDGTYGITGTTNLLTGPGGPLQVFIMKITPGGMPIWFKIYSLPVMGSTSQSRRIVAMPDGGFVVCGWTNAFDPAPNRDIWVFRVTAAGFPMWSNVYGLMGVPEEAHAIIYQPSDMSLVLTGFNVTGGSEDIILGKLVAATGAPIWFRHCPNTAGPDRGYDLEESIVPAGYSVTGRLFPAISSSFDPFFLKTNPLGLIPGGCIDTVIYQPRVAQIVRIDSLQPQYMPLNDIQIQPQVMPGDPVVRDVCGLTGIIQNGSVTPDNFELKQNYPNPFNPTTNIGFSIPVEGFVNITIFDITGKEVVNIINEFKRSGNYTVEFDASNLPSGVYFYKISTAGFTETKKMLLIK